MYVMQYYGLSWEDALHLVQNRRYCISPNGGFMTQIKVSLTFVRMYAVYSTSAMRPRSTSQSTRPRM